MRLSTRRCRTVAFELRRPQDPRGESAQPAMPNEGGAAAMKAALADAVAKGEITADQAAEMAKLVERFIDANEAAAFRNKLQVLEDEVLARKH
jgi:hypothetical protein